MAVDARESDKDWRLEAELDVSDTRGALHNLLGRLRGPDVGAELAGRVPSDVVITHDGRLLFAYAASEAVLADVRVAIESVLRGDSIAATMRVSHWDDVLDEWVQSDPPATPEERLRREADARAAEAIETRTLVAKTGKMIREEFEQTMRNWAQQLGLECETIEHPHLLRTQVAFTVTGPRRKIDEFATGLEAEGWATIRAEARVMLSPI